MGYPKYVFVLWLIMTILGGYVFYSLEWIGFTGFMGLLVLSLPIYWLETSWRNQAITTRIAKDKLRILPFTGWSFERLLYYQFIALIVLSLPGLFLDQSEVTTNQSVLASTFVIGLLVSKYYRERNELQSYQLTKEQFKVFEYGFSKKVSWKEIKGFETSGQQFIIQTSDKRVRLQPQTMKEEDRAYLLKTLKGFAQKKELPFRVKLEGDKEVRPWYLEDWKQGLLFVGATVLNVFLVLSY